MPPCPSARRRTSICAVIWPLIPRSTKPWSKKSGSNRFHPSVIESPRNTTRWPVVGGNAALSAQAALRGRDPRSRRMGSESMPGAASTIGVVTSAVTTSSVRLAAQNSLLAWSTDATTAIANLRQAPCPVPRSHALAALDWQPAGPWLDSRRARRRAPRSWRRRPRQSVGVRE